MNLLKKTLLILLVLALAMPFAASCALGEKTPRVIRVLLTKLNLTDRLEISLDGSYTLNDLAFQRGSRLTAAVSGGEIMIYYEGMALNAGRQAVLVRHAVSGNAENGLRLSGGYELHPGDLHLTASNGRLQAVLYAPVEEYLLGVVPYEMSDNYPLEALKAQAVAARTYAMRKAIQASQKDSYDIVDNTNDQVYYGVKKENDNAARAVKETAGVCGYYKGSLAQCYYSASNGGQTELPHHMWGQGGDLGYYAMTDDPYDLENKESPLKTASLPKTLSSNDDLGALKKPVLGLVSEAVENMGYDGDMEHILITGIEKAETALPLYTDSPSKIMTVLRLTLNVQARRLIEDDGEEDVSIFSYPLVTTPEPRQDRKEETYSAMKALPQPVTVALDIFPNVESALDLSINAGSNEIITIRETKTAFVLESRRYGHGVGMSQRGAQRMAEGYQWTYKQILRFYYPGMELKTLDTSFTLPAALSRHFLATPGPAATPTPRPTLIPLSATPGPGQFLVKVTNIGVNSYLNLRSEPNTQSTVLRQLFYGQELLVVKELEGWYKVKAGDEEGYVMRDFVVKTASP